MPPYLENVVRPRIPHVFGHSGVFVCGVPLRTRCSILWTHLHSVGL